MNLKIPLAAVAAATLLAGAWLALRPPGLPELPAIGAAPAPVVADARIVPPPPTTAAPSAARLPANPLGIVPAPERQTLFNEYLKARQYRAIYDRLAHSAAGETAEGRLVLYEILRKCATVTEGRRFRWRPRTPKREDFLAALPPSDPRRDQRIAAYEEFTANRCAGFEGMALTQAALDQLLADAAAAGDPRARAMAIEQALWTERRNQGRNTATITDGQIDELKQVLASRDPEAIRVAGRVLSNSWADYSLRLGPDQVPVEQRPFMNAWLVLACEFGQPCGADTPRMQQACAINGHCDTGSFPDYLYYYGSTPHDSQLLVQYRAYLRQAIESGDWSQLTVVRGVPTTGRRVTFVPGPR